METKKTMYVILKGERVTFPVKPTPIIIEGTVTRVRVEVKGSDGRIYLVDPEDISIVKGGCVIDGIRD